jgi:hypothetical protein
MVAISQTPRIPTPYNPLRYVDLSSREWQVFIVKV